MAGIWEGFKKAIGVEPREIKDLEQKALQQHGRQVKPPSKPSGSSIEITPEYKEIMQWLEAKAPLVFVTGKAGTGKSTFIQYLRDCFTENMAVVAPTGVAALNVGGATIHSFFRLPPRIATDDDIHLVRDRRLYRKLKLLVIDEISMVRADVVDAMDQFLKLNREVQEPFGGVQVVMVGDLFQLPPVVQAIERDVLAQMAYQSPYFFSAKVLKSGSMVTKELTKIYRQSEEEFIRLLNRVRVGDVDEEALNQINGLSENGEAREGVITLCATNRVADAINDEELKNIESEEKTFMGNVTGKFALEETKLPSPMNLTLKVGAQVMFTKNDETKRWVNGTVGKVVELKDESATVVILDGTGRAYEVGPVEWETFKYELKDEAIKPVSMGKYTQLPLMLAWAVTIHKSQGKTLDKVRIDLGSGAFDYGQVYVALSRCKAMSGISLAKPMNKSDIRCDPVIKRFYEALNERGKPSLSL